MSRSLSKYGCLTATQAETRAVLKLLTQRRFTRHLEIETYTWGLLPEDLKMNLGHSGNGIPVDPGDPGRGALSRDRTNL